MIPPRQIPQRILCIVGPTASGKSARAVSEALARNGEIISVDSRQIYRGLDIGTEKITATEMRGVPHHLIDILDARETYSAGNFVADASRLIGEITVRGKPPILAGGTHFYFDALLNDLPKSTPINPAFRAELEMFSTEELYRRIHQMDTRRATELDPRNRRRIIRALEIIEALGSIPLRSPRTESENEKVGYQKKYQIEWIVVDPPREELRAKIDARLTNAFKQGLMDEVRRVRDEVGDARLNELGLEYRVVGEYLRSDANAREINPSDVLLPVLSAKLWQYARRQKAWLRKLHDEKVISMAPYLN